MSYQSVFKRYELKYIITKKQKDIILNAMKSKMALDEYGRTTIRNIYFDTNNYRLVRHSIEKPAYKEKLRIRSYSQASSESPVFVELKKKYQSVVYKRRLSLPEKEAMQWVCGNEHCKKCSQISDEIDYFLDYYDELHPVVFLTYEREAYYSLDGDDFRVTFDENILCRRADISLESDVWGIKCSGAIPMWMAHVLSQNHIYKTSFSKYGTAYESLIFPNLKEECINA